MQPRRLVAITFSSLLGMSCTTPPAPRAPQNPDTPPIALSELEPVLEQQAAKLGLDEVASLKLKRAIEKLVRDPEFRRDAEQYTVNAVGWFQMGEGGAVVKYADGSGAVGSEQRPFRLRAWSVGAQIGGSASRGVLVVLGLEHASNFAGDYSAERARATAVTESASMPLQLRNRTHGHLVYVVDVSAGLSAAAGIGRVRVQWR
jgi:hypothetical protein